MLHFEEINRHFVLPNTGLSKNFGLIILLSTAGSEEKSVQIEEKTNAFAILFLSNQHRTSQVAIERPVF